MPSLSTKLLLGMLAALVANALLVANNYVIREFALQAGDLILVRGLVQVPVFYFLARIASQPLILSDKRVFFYVVLQGVGYATLVLLCSLPDA